MRPEIRYLFTRHASGFDGSNLARASYAAYRAFMRSVVGRDVPEHDLDDLAHDALLVGLQRIDASYGELAVRRYERTTVVRLLARLRAHLQRRIEWLDEFGDPAVPPDTRIVTAEVLDAMNAVLSRDERQVMWRRLAGDSYIEISEDLQLCSATARSLYHRALGKTHKYINGTEMRR